MRMKKISIMLLSALLVFSSFPLTASSNEGSSAGEYASKDEVVYGNLGASGSVQDMYVVNTFHVTEPGQITDYGNYTHVRNLSNLAEMEQTEGGKVQFQAEEGEFYYQGEMENQPLPWDISITYLLDGEEISPDELAGKSGEFEMQISTSANENANSVFFENYLLQISLTLDPSKFNQIQAPDGTEANAGKNKQITFTVLPEKEEELIVTADVTNFEMDPISISAAPYSMSMESPDLSGMTGDMESLADAISEINNGVGELNNGIAELGSGAANLSNGSSDYRSGINELDQSSGELINGSAAIRDALETMSESVQGSSGEMDLGNIEALPAGLREIAGGIKESAAGLDALRENYSGAYSELEEAMAGIPDYQISEDQIQGLRGKLEESGADTKVLDQLAETYTAAKAAKQTYNSVQEAFAAVTGTLEEVAAANRELASSIETTAAEIENAISGMEQMDSLAQLQEGLSSLSAEYQSFHNGLVSYTDGVGELAGSYQELDAGIQELADGTASLESGAGELHNGTQELQESTSDLPGQIEEEADEMLEEYDASDFEPQSFVSDKNEKIGVVQFVLQTESIEMEEEEEAAQETEVEEEQGFWDRLLGLFQ